MRNAGLVSLPLENKEEIETDGPETGTFSLVEVGEGNDIDPNGDSVTVTFYDSLDTAPTPDPEPEVSLTISETELVESEGNTTTLTFNVDEEIPDGGILVYINSTSGNRGELGEFRPLAKIFYGIIRGYFLLIFSFSDGQNI